MKKEEILEKSRSENKNKDLYEKEVIKEGGTAVVFVAGILIVVFFCIQAFTGGGINYGLYAIAMSMSATGASVKAFKLKKQYDIIIAVLYWIMVLAFASNHIYNLILAS